MTHYFSKFDLGWIFHAIMAITKLLAVSGFMLTIFLAVIYSSAFAQAYGEQIRHLLKAALR